MLLLDEENIARCANEGVARLGKYVAKALDQGSDEEGYKR